MSSFELIIEVVDTGDYVEVPLFQVCDDDPLDGITAFDLNIQTPIIQGGDANLDITYHENQGEADDESSSIDVLIPYTSPNQVIYVRVENATTSCYDTFEMELEVISVIGVIPTDIIECDEVPNDGKAIFDLTVREIDILDGQIAVLSYYELEAEAEIGDPVIAIADPVNFENTINDTQTVYVRLEEPILGCFDVVPLNLVVNEAPAIAEPIAPYPLCDNDEDGTEVFNLTSKNTEIENGLPNITLTYYNDPDDAEEGNPANEIPTPTAYPSTGGETIWVRAVNLDGCVTVSSFELVIDTVPDYTPIPLFQVCDDSNPDGQTDFDLDSQNIDIATVGGIFNPDLTVTYHLTEADAEAGTIPSLSSPFNNTNPFSQIIWVRVEDDITGCYGDFQMELNVISPIAGTPTPLVECDEVPNDGLADFDLLDPILLGEIINGQTDMAVTFHLDQSEADAGTPILPNTYNGTTQTIYARLQSTLPGFQDCYDTIALDLIVNAAPVTDFVASRISAL